MTFRSKSTSSNFSFVSSRCRIPVTMNIFQIGRICGGLFSNSDSTSGYAQRSPVFHRLIVGKWL